MRSRHVYVKTRAQFGKQCIFNIQEPNIDDEILPNSALYNNFIQQNPCQKSVQISKQFALHEVQTIGKSFKNNGMFHYEGGWPKEINPRDEETTARFRRRVEKEDDWAPSLRGLFSRAENCILQNSAMNVYDHYFDDMIPTELVRPRCLRTLNVYADPNPIPRPVSNISWSPDSVTKIAVSYCYTEFGKAEDYNFMSYIWEIENSNEPWAALESFCPVVVTEFNPRDPSVLASGLMSGQVCNWDIRTGNVPVQQSHLQFSHRNPANCLKWMLSKNNSEFFTGSPDGRIMWWDIRKLRQPTEILIIDLDNTKYTKVENAIGVTSLNYEPSMGTKFLFGTENGVIVSGSRKSKTRADKLALRFQGHYGPVHSVDRNPFNPKYILSIGDWTSRIWAEDTKEGNLVATPFCKEFPTGGCWSKSKYSIFYVINRRGELEAWDLLVGLNYPVVTTRLSEARLTTIAPHEEGTLISVGDLFGNIYLVEASAALTSFEKNDRIHLISYLDRCSCYMKAIDARLREIRLMKKDDSSDKPADDEEIEKEMNFDDSERDEQSDEVKESEKDPELEKAEDQYFKIIKAEKEKYESVEDFNDAEDMITKVPTTLDVTAEKKRVESKDKNEKNGKNKLNNEEIVMVKRKKKPEESTEASQKITQDAEIIEVLEKELKGRKMNERMVKGIAAKILSELLGGSKPPRPEMIKLTKPCDSICNIKVCCKDIINASDQKRNHRKKIRGKTTKTQNKIEESLISEKSISNEEIDWKSIEKSPSTKIILPKIALLEKQDIENEITTALNILSFRAKRAKKINIGDDAIWKQSFEKNWNFNSVHSNSEYSDGQNMKKFLGGKDDKEGLDEIPSALEATDRTSADFKSVDWKKSITRKHRMIPTGDTCTPKRPLQTIRHIESFVKGPVPVLQESRLQDSSLKRYKEEVEAARARIYPRISAFPEPLFSVLSPNSSLPTDPDLMPSDQPNK